MAEKEYIERGSALEIVKRTCGDYAAAFSEIRQLPAADVAEVVHGEWKTTDAYPHWLCCSECHVKFVPNIEWIGIYAIPTKFCPNCGAKMDLEATDER